MGKDNEKTVMTKKKDEEEEGRRRSTTNTTTIGAYIQTYIHTLQELCEQ